MNYSCFASNKYETNGNMDIRHRWAGGTLHTSTQCDSSFKDAFSDMLISTTLSLTHAIPTKFSHISSLTFTKDMDTQLNLMYYVPIVYGAHVIPN